MFSIGDFARLGGVSPRTLRYYEELGLLDPIAVDATTGYRSYSAHQLPRLNRIVALKDLGLSLEQLRPLLDDLSAEQLRGMLQLKRAELQEQLADDQARLTRVEQRLRHIEGEGTVPLDVLVKHLPPQRVASIRCATAQFDTMEPAVTTAFGEMEPRLTKAGVHLHGPVFLYYEALPDGNVVPHVAVDIGDQSVPVDELIGEFTLPAIDVATTIYRGSEGHAAIGPIYGQLAQWAADHGYEAKGPGRDLIVSTSDGAEPVIEIQLPIAKPAG